MSTKKKLPLLKIIVVAFVGSYVSTELTRWVLSNAGLYPMAPDAVLWAVTLTKIGVSLLTMAPCILVLWYVLRRGGKRDENKGVIDNNHENQ